MKNIVNLPISYDVLKEYTTQSGYIDFCEKCGCDGFELVWGGEKEEIFIPNTIGWHISFYTDWLDFWYEKTKKLNQKFGSKEIWTRFYGGTNKEALLKYYENDLERAEKSGAEYVVFHVSNVSIEECYTYDYDYSDQEVIDEAAKILNIILKNKKYKFQLLVENLHWSGFRFTNYQLTKRLLDNIEYENKGIMLDIGHLLCTNLEIKNQKEAVRYLHEMLDIHKELCSYIKGIHLHQSISGDYVKKNIEFFHQLPKDFYNKFTSCYQHVLRIDQHLPWTDEGICSIIDRIKPMYLVHELSSSSRKEKEKNTMLQMQILKGCV